MIRDQNGDFVGSSIPLNFKGTFDVYEKSFLDHSIETFSGYTLLLGSRMQ